MNRIHAVLFLLTLSGIAFGQNGISLPEARQMALANSRQMALSRLMAEQGRMRIRQYRAKFFPSLSASGNYILSTSRTHYSLDPNEIVGPSLAKLDPLLPLLLGSSASGLSLSSLLGPLPLREYTLSLNNSFIVGVHAKQPLYVGGKIVAAYTMAKIGSEIAELNQSLTEANVLLQTEEAYWQCVQLAEMEVAAQAYCKTVDEFTRVVENAVKAELKTPNDLLKVQVKQNEAKLLLRRAQNGLALARMNLNRLVGLPLHSETMTTETLDGDAESLPPAGGGLDSRPDYQIVQKQEALKREEVKLVRGDFLPQVGVQASYSYANGVQVNDKALVDGHGLTAIVSVNIPIFQFGEGRNKVRAARLEQEMAHARTAEAAELMQLEMAKCANAYQEAQLNVQLAEESLKQATKNMEMSQKRYEAGQTLLADHLEAQTAWQKALTDHIAARVESKLALMRWRKALGLFSETIAPARPQP